jgi:hypothetical protein
VILPSGWVSVSGVVVEAVFWVNALHAFSRMLIARKVNNKCNWDDFLKDTFLSGLKFYLSYRKVIKNNVHKVKREIRSLLDIGNLSL